MFSFIKRVIRAWQLRAAPRPTAQCPTMPTEEAVESSLFQGLLMATHVARDLGFNVRFLTFSEFGNQVHEGFLVYDWGNQGAYGCSVRVHDDGGVIVCDESGMYWLAGFVRGFRDGTGLVPTIHSNNLEFVSLIIRR